MNTLQYLDAIPYHTYTWASFALGVVVGGFVTGTAWMFLSIF